MKLHKHLLVDIFKAKVATDFIFLAAGQYGGMVLSIGFSLILARLLSPSDFGLVASSLFILNFFNWISEWGWESALMAHKQIDLSEAASTHFFVRFFLGALPLCCVSVFFFLPSFFGSKSISLIVLLALSFWLEKIGLTYKTILERHSLLKSLAFFEFFSSSTGLVAAVLAAFCGFGVFSLAVQRLVEKLILLIGYFWASPWKFGLKFRWKIVKTFFVTFGVASWIGGVFNLAIYEYFMPFLIGGMAGMHQAGLYAKAFSLATFPLMLTAICNRITSPIYTKNQFLTPRLRRCFVKVQTYKVFALLPMQIILAVSASFWIPMVLGDHWREMVSVYRIMTFYGLFRAFFDDVPPVISLGFKDPWALTWNQVIQSIIVVSIGPIAVSVFGASGGALSMSFAMLLASVFFWHTALSRLNCSGVKFLAIARSALMSLGGLKWIDHG
ncbi:oligosaccharide flippase family protein [Candidatus Dependentiae bacterium]